ncbi:hypothetical protein SAMN02745784_01012 [Tissierella praeacuta DSM 18095]|uniref:Uncharacterized protein n=1 Tax=Tissierella praeacuta DSM 18095 TaxID=1123404 RepID=A0A1M4UCV0_9FIRM|nr:hypothetical protein [Tissierella praeacuta]TCU77228.1 hypothetical protein EV204_10287 [Tissierella praeacuta]SHE54504.1 hypothetical protein SAMN02745784_01012 [Tissierella praeacuta DSM 18095]SUP03997.1 Uncharacterised protein [Tissierella praeacuta]
MSGIGEWAITRYFRMNGFIEIPIELSKVKIYFSYTCDTDNEKLGTEYNIDELVANLYGIKEEYYGTKV